MNIRTNASQRRKLLVSKMSELLNDKAHYEGAPTFNYRFAVGTVDREATIHLAPTLKEQAARQLAEALADWGFECEVCSEPDSSEIETLAGDAAVEAEPAPEERFTIRFPHSKLEGSAIDRFQNLVQSKRALIAKVLGCDELLVNIEDGGETVALPWFEIESSAEEREAYRMFVDKLVALANQLKTARLIEREFDNEKYAFRCFLLRLGFIGKEYKSARKVLTRNLDGNSAFKCGYDPRVKKPKEVSNLPMIIQPSPLDEMLAAS